MIEEQMKQNLNEHRDIKTLLQKMDYKLDDVITNKADKRELDKKADRKSFEILDEKLKVQTNYLLMAGAFIITLLITIIGYLVSNGGL